MNTYTLKQLKDEAISKIIKDDKLTHIINESIKELKSNNWTEEDSLLWQACETINKLKQTRSMETLAQYIDMKWEALCSKS